MGALVGILVGVFLIVVIIFATIFIPLYIIGSLGLMRLAKNRGFEAPWLAWIPIGNLFLLGRLVNNIDMGSVNINKIYVVYPIMVVASIPLQFIPLIGWVSASILGIALFVLEILIYIKLYKMYSPRNYVLYTVLSVFGFAPILFYEIRNNIPYYVPSFGKPLFKQ
jgi:hypothetical protein